MIRLVLPFVSLAFVVTACSGPLPAASAAPVVAGEQATVTKVVDGDTLHATTSSGVKLTIRVLSFDSPEVVDPRKPIQCWGPQASAEGHRLLDGQTVRLEPDPTQAATDKYKRALRRVILPDGRDYSVVMAGEGMGRDYVYDRKPAQNEPAVAAAQGQAQTGKRGLWGPPCDGGR